MKEDFEKCKYLVPLHYLYGDLPIHSYLRLRGMRNSFAGLQYFVYP